MSAIDRTEVIRAWRAGYDPDRHRRVQLYALDLIADGDSVMPFDLLCGLTDEERAAYLADVADSLAFALARFLDWWVLNEYTSIEDWRASRGVD